MTQIVERTFLPPHRQISSGRTFDRPWSPSAYGGAGEHHKASMSYLDVLGWVGSVLIVALVLLVVYAPGGLSCLGF